MKATGVISFEEAQSLLLRCSVMSYSATPWTVAHQALLSTWFSRQEYWSISFSRDFPDPGIRPVSLTSPGLARGFFTTSTIWEALRNNEFHGLFKGHGEFSTRVGMAVLACHVPTAFQIELWDQRTTSSVAASSSLSNCRHAILAGIEAVTVVGSKG